MSNIRLFIAILLSVGILYAKPGISQWAVFDSANYSQAVKEFNQFIEQLKAVNEVRDSLEEVSGAIGEVGQVVLPITNLTKIKGQLEKDAQCLIPNMDDIFGLEFDEMTFSICDRGVGYRNQLAVNPENIIKGQQGQIHQLQTTVRRVRENLLYEASTKGLAQSELAVENSQELNIAADDLERNLALCQDVKCIAEIDAQIQVALVRVHAQRLQVEAQNLRVLSAFTIINGVSVRSPLPEVPEESATVADATTKGGQ